MSVEVDVTDVLLDADVAGETFDVVRRLEMVDDYGVSRTSDEIVRDVLGSVQPTGDNSVTRDEAYDVKAKTLEVVTQFRLRGVSASGGQNYKPDRVLWAGDCYEVRSIDNWTAFGGGFVRAECVQIDYVGEPGGSPPPSGVIGMLDFSQTANSGYARGAGGP